MLCPLTCQKCRLSQNKYLSTPNEGNYNSETEKVPPKGDGKDADQNDKESKEIIIKMTGMKEKLRVCNFS